MDSTNSKGGRSRTDGFQDRQYGHQCDGEYQGSGTDRVVSQSKSIRKVNFSVNTLNRLRPLSLYGIVLK